MVSAIEKASSVYALINMPAVAPVQSVMSAPVHAPSVSSASTSSSSGYEMSEWAKLIIIWTLLKAMKVDENFNGAPISSDFTPAIPPSAGMAYNQKGQVIFGPTPAGQALAGESGLPDAAGISPMSGIGGGGGPVVSGVGGGMAGAFVSVSV